MLLAASWFFAFQKCTSIHTT